jgi:hypothetical protein
VTHESTVSPTLNRERLLSVVNGDWSPYITSTPVTTWGVGQTQNMTYLDTKTDWDLLRHDIHVLLAENKL